MPRAYFEPDQHRYGDAGPLFAPRQAHSATSTRAAEKIESRSAVLRARVHDWIRDRGTYGSTDEEAQDGLGMNPSTQRPRRVELCRAGLVVDSGTTRPTRSGRRAVVWVVA